MTASYRVGRLFRCSALFRSSSIRAISSETSSSAPKIPSIVVKQSKAKLFQDAFVPLIYSNAIARVDNQVSAGQDCRVVDEAGAIVGRGFYNPHSLFRVRLIASPRLDQTLMESPLEDILSQRFRSAVRLRQACGLPSPGATTAYRLVHSEGDVLSGLIVDVFDNTAVVQSSSLWTERYREVITSSLRAACPGMDIIWRQSMNFLRQDGWNGTLSSNSGNSSNSTSRGDTEEPEEGAINAVIIIENGLRYRTLPGFGQKTGFYFDQRENRALVGALCSDKSVLDMYCFTGGFTLNALKNGCKKVTAVDSSDKAIERARENLSLNENLDASRAEFIESDAESFMQAAIARGDTYDVVIIDPPKLAPNADALAKAKKKYDRINRMAMQLISPSGGWLFTCTCSGAMAQSPGTFERIIACAAQGASRSAQIVAHRGAAMDHPVVASMSENVYFKACLVRVL